MFKAVNTIDGSDIIILDPQWKDDLDSLRSLDRQDFLVCQECRQPVRVRAGEIRCQHFAHKHRENCTLESESPELLNARAVLYEKLYTVFGAAVTVEKKLNIEHLCRPVDCWIEDSEHRIAYWLFDKKLRPQAREAIRNALKDAGAITVHCLFTGEMLRESAEGVNLSTTEREFARHTPYDEVNTGIPKLGETLHYLDTEARIVTTFRALLPVCGPLYHGRKLQHPLADILVSPDTGAFIHPGEAERLAERQAKLATEAERRAELEQARAAQVKHSAVSVSPVHRQHEIQITPLAPRTAQPVPSRSAYSPAPSLTEREGVCEYCGQRTTDWWSFDGKTGMCKCNACSNRGRAIAAQFRIPLAFDEYDILTPPGDADKCRAYRCPACHEPVILRKGDVKVAHFAHRASNACSEETILHQTAKLLIQQTIRAWKSGQADAPIILRACSVCEGAIETTPSRHITDAVLEHRLADASVADVALLGGDVVVAAVEIRVSHAVEERKAQRLPVPFIELDGEAVIANPRRWEPLAHSMKILTCQKCLANYERFRVKAEEIARRTHITLPTRYYRYGICGCYRCGSDILVFTWPGHDLHDATTPAVQPWPSTIQFRSSKMAHTSYWVNTCPDCHAIQGDFFLYAEPDGPFFGTHCGDDTPEAFKRDLLSIAHYADYLGVLKDE